MLTNTLTQCGWENGKPTEIVKDVVSTKVDGDTVAVLKKIKPVPGDLSVLAKGISTSTTMRTKLTESEILDRTQMIASVMDSDDIRVLLSVQNRGYNGHAIDPVVLSTKGNQLNGITRGLPGFLTPQIAEHCLNHFVRYDLALKTQSDKKSKFSFNGGIYKFVELVLGWHFEKQIDAAPMPVKPDEVETKPSTVLLSLADVDTSMITNDQKNALHHICDDYNFLYTTICLCELYEKEETFSIRDLQFAVADFVAEGMDFSKLSADKLYARLILLEGLGFVRGVEMDVAGFAVEDNVYEWVCKPGQKPYTAKALIKTLLS